MSALRPIDRAKAAAALLTAELGDFPHEAQLEIIWLRGYSAGIERGIEIINKSLPEEPKS